MFNPAAQLFAGALAAVVIAFVAYVGNKPWEETPLYGAYERIASLADPLGTQNYTGANTFNKGDNNRFRVVWWRNVVEETFGSNPVFGLGFGADLARGFVQEYYPENGEEFTTRSPHNIAVTAFGRMGMIGLAAWLYFCIVLVVRAWGALRRSDDPVLRSLWCGAGVILCSACFGVVLEGPMGAVIFWIMLGLANGHPPAPAGPVPAAHGTALQ